MNVRTIGLFTNVKDIEQTVLTTKSGTPLRVKDIAEVSQGAKVRLGHEGRAIRREDGEIVDNDDVIFAQVMMRKGADSGPTLEKLHAKVEQLNHGILPPGVKLEPMIDRSDLLAFTLDTVLHNLGEGMILVTIILFPVSAQCSRRSHRFADHTVCSLLCFHPARLDQSSRQPALAGRAGFRNGRGRRRGDGGKHRAAHEPPQEWFLHFRAQHHHALA